MPSVVTFVSPRQVELQDSPTQELVPGSVRIRTWYSGISAGTELTAYRGSNPYLTRTWDADRRIFTDGAPTFGYPVSGWGYSEMGEVLEVADDVTGLTPGDRVYGIWGHRSEAVMPADKVRVLADGADPRVGCFARVGAIALNAILAADTRLGTSLAVFGQGVIGLLATRLGVLAGAEVAAVDVSGPPPRGRHGLRGAGDLRPPRRGWRGSAAAPVVRRRGGRRHRAERQHRRAARGHPGGPRRGVVAASGFYQGGADGLRLGEEFHHNRVRLVSSQISGVPVGLSTSWDQPRLVKVFMGLATDGRLDVAPLITDVVDAGDVASAYQRLDEGDPEILQVLLRFDGAPE